MFEAVASERLKEIVSTSSYIFSSISSWIWKGELVSVMRIL